MGVRIESGNDSCRVYFDGDLTVYTVADYQKAILASSSAEGNIEVDLSQVDELDTCGLQLLAALGRYASDAGNGLTCVNPSEQVAETLELSRFLDALNCNNNDGPES
jgi:anti-sigma B factor antagonist